MLSRNRMRHTFADAYAFPSSWRVLAFCCCSSPSWLAFLCLPPAFGLPYPIMHAIFAYSFSYGVFSGFMVAASFLCFLLLYMHLMVIMFYERLSLGSASVSTWYILCHLICSPFCLFRSSCRFTCRWCRGTALLTMGLLSCGEFVLLLPSCTTSKTLIPVSSQAYLRCMFSSTLSITIPCLSTSL